MHVCFTTIISWVRRKRSWWPGVIPSTCVAVKATGSISRGNLLAFNVIGRRACEIAGSDIVTTGNEETFPWQHQSKFTRFPRWRQFAYFRALSRKVVTLATIKACPRLHSPAFSEKVSLSPEFQTVSGIVWIFFGREIIFFTIFRKFSDISRNIYTAFSSEPRGSLAIFLKQYSVLCRKNPSRKCRNVGRGQFKIASFLK